MSTVTLLKWKHDAPEFMEAVGVCREVGIGLYESELNKRALAGKEDPGSANLLKLKLQSVDDAYRDKRESNVTVFNIANSEAVGPVLGAWQRRRVIEGEAAEVVQGTPSPTSEAAAPIEQADEPPAMATGGG